MSVANATMERMKVTKLEHAGVVIELNDASLVIDPGKFTATLPSLSNVVGIVLTHEHDDHTYAPHVVTITQQFPGAKVWATQASRNVLAASGIASELAVPGESAATGPFTVSFFGGRHAIIHQSIPQIDNVGVAVNGRFFYPGDSFAEPEGPVELLAVPSSAPWLKASEVIDYVLAVRPARTFPTHDWLWAPAGAALADARIKAATEQNGGEFTALAPGESIVI